MRQFIVLIFLILSAHFLFSYQVLASNAVQNPQKLLASHQISMDQRYPVKSVNTVFKDNILLNLAYLGKNQIDPKKVDWNQIENLSFVKFVLKPGQTFAFSDDVLDQYKDSLAVTTGAHFDFQEGFKSDGYLYGDGVCHLASLMFWTASDAGLLSLAPTNHNFYPIAQIPKEYGVSIYYQPGSKSTNAKHNLYITNNFDKNVAFEFNYDGTNLQESIYESIY